MNEQARTESYRIDNKIFFRLFQLGNLLQTKSTNILGITTVQWSVLGALSSKGPDEGFLFGALAEYLKVSRQNLDGVLRRLERDGYVVRVAGESDRRARLVQVTPKGRNYWRSLERGIETFYQEATADFSLNEKIALAYLFDKLRSNLSAMGEGEPEG